MASLVQQDHSEHREYLRDAVERIFPVLCYRDEEIAAFIDESRERTGDRFYLLESSSGAAALVKTSLFGEQGSAIKYIVPTDWKARYQVVQSAVEAIKSESQRQGALKLFTCIVESVPSHNAYYAGMLPLMDFEMTPRIRLVAPFDVLRTLVLPQLPAGIEEADYSAERLSEVARVWYEADIEHYPGLTEWEKEQWKPTAFRMPNNARNARIVSNLGRHYCTTAES